MQIHVEEFARLTSLLSNEERESVVDHSTLCRCIKCKKVNMYLLLKDQLERWERYRAGNENEVRQHYIKYKTIERLIKEEEERISAKNTI